MTAFAHLHVHSNYSLLEGFADPSQLIRAAQNQGMPALALTDHLNLSGSIEFYLGCRKASIQPIMGLEINLVLPKRSQGSSHNPEQGPVVLLATSSEGWANLCRLTSSILDHAEADSSSPCSFGLLANHTAGLICLSGGRRSLAYHLIKTGRLPAASGLMRELNGLFPGRFYAEIQIHTEEDGQIAKQLSILAQKDNIPLVATQDIYYLDPSQEAVQHSLCAIRLNQPLTELKPSDCLSPQAHWISPDDMIARFKDFPQAVTNTQEIASLCRFDLPIGTPHFPIIPLPNGITAAARLRQKSIAGAKRLYGSLNPEIEARLEHELSVITALGFEPVFLIMEEILQWARQAGVPFSSRGSAASSLVAHCLGITNPDPLQLNLYFERFLNPARSTPPDIDTDLCSRRRDQVLHHVVTTYGTDRVAMVGTINRFRPRSALGEVAKAHGFTPAEVRQLVAALPYHYYYRGDTNDEEEIPPSPFQELEGQFPSSRHRFVFNQAAAILGLPRHLSVHAGGVVITPGPLTDLLPVQQANKGITITQLDHKALEPLGIIKLDLLGIRGLTVLGDVAETIRNWRQSEYSSSLSVLDDIPLDDPLTLSRIENGQTIGCFQIESPGMRSTLKEIRAKSLEDIMVALALYRPGPLTGGLKDAFVRRHNGLEAVTHLHPTLEKLLADTYGVILYQEQVLRIAHDLAGLSLAESDLLRRAMSHFDPGKQIQTLKEKFVHGAGIKSGVDPDTADRIWDLMAAFSGYGFPKAHAASYALVAYRSAWCKTHFPAEFMAAVLANWGGYYSQRVYLMEARRMGLKVRPPHINHGSFEFSVAYPDGHPVLYMGLDQVRDLTRRTQQHILLNRPFASLDDFLLRANPRLEEAANLIRCGALEGLGSQPALLTRLYRTGKRPIGQMMLFEEAGDENIEPEWSLAAKVKAQEEILGISVDAHPLELVASSIRSFKAISTLEAAARVGERVRVAGMRQISRRSRTTQGKWMLFLTIEDLEGVLDTVLFPEIYQRYRVMMTLNLPFVIEGIMERDSGRDEPILRAEKLFKL